MNKNNTIKNKIFNLKLTSIFFILIFLFIQIAKADNKSIENLISHYVATQKQEQLSLLEKLVNIYELVRILDTMRIQLANEKYLSFSPGLILGGTTVNYDKTSSQGTAFGN